MWIYSGLRPEQNEVVKIMKICRDQDPPGSYEIHGVRQYSVNIVLQWRLSVTTTSIIKIITCDLFSDVFWWWLNVPINSC